VSRDQLQGPQRVVCLTEETTETLYLLGEEARIVGISGFTVRPPQARKEKPKVSGFTSAKIDKILALAPDLVLGFSDLQADIAAALIRHGLAVHVFNQRSVEGILDMIGLLGAMVGTSARAEALVEQYRSNLEAVRNEGSRLPRRPRVYFEEWDNPLISGIRWVSELIGIAGGEECFPELTTAASAKDRIIADPNEVVRRAPTSSAGWDAIPAVRTGHVYEIKSADILQPGPAALGDGLAQIRRIIMRWAEESRP
jgi:iron complex transport system substrate-binding protein